MKNNLLKMIPPSSILRKKRTFALTAFAIISAFFFVAATKSPQNNITIATPEKTGISTIVFDLGNVLFTVPKSTRVKTIVPTIFYNPSLLYWLTKISAEDAYFNFLKTLPAESKQITYHNGKPTPLIMSDWMSGIKTPAQIKKMIDQQLAKSNHPAGVKNLFAAIADLMFVPENLASTQKLVVPMAQLLKKFKNAGYKICILSNWDAHSFELVKNKYPKLFNLCDTILISGKEKMSKPNPAFFNKVLEQCNVDASKCLFIDDEAHNITIASQLGFTTIQHVDVIATSKKLISKGIVTLCKKV